MEKLKTIFEIFRFMMKRKAFWLLPIVILLIALSIIIIATQGSALLPFIYALF